MLLLHEKSVNKHFKKNFRTRKKLSACYCFHHRLYFPASLTHLRTWDSMEIFFALEKSHSATCLMAHSFKEGCMCYYYLHAVTCSPAPLLLIEYGNGINYASIKISRENLSSTKCVCVSRFISIYACVRFTIKKNMITWVFLTLNAFHECMQ